MTGVEAPAPSLRARLTVIILGPLLLIASVAGYWAWQDAVDRAADRFDRSLLSTALAISRDTAFSGGDALSENTRDLLRDTSGGPVFYHVYAPDGVFVTGYATPPVPPGEAVPDTTAQVYYDAIYQGRPVRALRFSDVMVIDGLAGPFTFTVWQDTDVRAQRVRGLIRGTTVVIVTLIAALAIVVWFGVRLGLRPLNDLEEAISRRSVSDLSAIRRPIPPEVTGIVGTLNNLLGELSGAMGAKDVFISNAAHQLRNPIAGVLSLAESLQGAPDGEAIRRRSDDIVEGARELSRLADGLLTLERANALDPDGFERIELQELLGEQVPEYRRLCTHEGADFSADLGDRPAAVLADPLLLEQSIRNLITNALVHGGPKLGHVALSLRAGDGTHVIRVADDGAGLDAKDVPTALSRFGQVRPSQGSGLGLSIVEAAASAFGGEVTIETSGPGLVVMVSLPGAKD